MAIEPNTDPVPHEARDSKVPDSYPDPEPSVPLPIESDWAPIMEFTAADIFQHSPFGDILNFFVVRIPTVLTIIRPGLS